MRLKIWLYTGLIDSLFIENSLSEVGNVWLVAEWVTMSLEGKNLNQVSFFSCPRPSSCSCTSSGTWSTARAAPSAAWSSNSPTAADGPSSPTSRFEFAWSCLDNASKGVEPVVYHKLGQVSFDCEALFENPLLIFSLDFLRELWCSAVISIYVKC